jgi:hypothetical protein
MKELIKYLPVLKLGCSNAEYPVFVQYVHSNGKIICSYNGGFLSNIDGIFVQIKQPLSFSGDLNVFVLDDIIKNIGNNFDYEIKDNKLIIQQDTFQTEILIVNCSFPEVPLPEVEKQFNLTADLYNDLKLANKLSFSDKSILSYVILDNNNIASIGLDKVFYKKLNLNTDFDPILINTRILSVLNPSIENMYIGSTNNNVLISYDNVEIFFEVDNFSEYPLQQLINFVNESNNNLVKLCNMSYFNEAIKKLSPIFFGESRRLFQLSNINDFLYFTAEVQLNGTAEYSCKSEYGDNFIMNFDMDTFKGIPIEYDVFINPELNDRLVLCNGNSYIIVKGK